jgi:hypothetical protein
MLRANSAINSYLRRKKRHKVIADGARSQYLEQGTEQSVLKTDVPAEVSQLLAIKSEYKQDSYQ